MQVNRTQETAQLPVRTSAGERHLDPRCRKCGSHLEPHSHGVRTCTVCARYTSVVGNAAKIRRDGTAPGVEMTLLEFAAWFAAQPRVCAYCHIPETLIEDLEVQTQQGHLLQRLGVDRLDTGVGYRPGNIALCCFGCNKAKSNTFSTAEMPAIGRGIADAWEARLQARNVRWTRCPGYRSKVLIAG